MNWFYATKEKTQAGPVDESALERLYQSGAITPTTLVWKEGMSDWQPYGSLFNSPPPVVAEPLSSGLVRCAECGQGFPPEQVINLAGRMVCGSCKPAAVQKLQEGVVSFGAPVDAEELWARIQQRGFEFTISSVISRAWELVKGNFWPAVGVTLLCYLIIMGASQIPFLNMLSGILVQTQIMAGLNWYFLKHIRGEGATLNDSFAGFRRGYWQQALYGLILMGIGLGVLLAVAIPVGGIVVGSRALNSEGGMVWVTLLAFAAFIPVMLVMWYFFVCWIFTPLLIVDKGMPATVAMKLSRRVVRLQFWKLVGLFFLTGLMMMGGLLAFIIGAVFVAPLLFAIFSQVYEDAFGENGPVIRR